MITELFLNRNPLAAASPILSSKDVARKGNAPLATAGDTVTYRFWFTDIAPGNTFGENQRLTNSNAILGARQAPGGTDNPYVLTGSLTEGGDGVDGWYYDVELDFANDDLLDLFGDTTQKVELIVDIEVQNLDNTQRQTVQFPMSVRRQMITGVLPPSGPALPAFPGVLINNTVFGVNAIGGWVQRTKAELYTFLGISTDGTLAGNSDTAVATQKAAKTYADTKAPLASPALTGTPTVPTAAVDTNTTQAASTAFVLAQAASANPAMNGVAAPGVSTRFSKADHVHPTDTSRAPLASPTFTGTPAAPTPAATVNSTQLATTAMVQGVNNASGSRTPLGTLSTAGNTDLPAATAQNRRRYFEVTVGAGSGAFTRTLAALTANAQAGDELEVSVTMPASLNPTVELRNNTSGGTLLATVPTDAAVSRTWSLWSRYNGTAWSTATLTPISAREYVSTYIDPIANSRAARQGLYFDGSNSARFSTPIAGPGTGDFDYSFLLSLNRTATETYWLAGSVNSITLSANRGGPGFLALYRNGDLASTLTSTVALTVGVPSRVRIRRSAGVSSWEINGVAAGSAADTNNYSAPLTTLGALDGNVVASFITVYAFWPYNYALTDAQVAALFRDGQPAAVDRGGSMPPLNTANWTTSGSGSISGNSSSGFAATCTGSFAVRSSPTFAARNGQRFLLTFSASGISGPTPTASLANIGIAYISSLTPISNGANSLVITATANATGNVAAEFTQSAAGTFTISGFSITPLGTLAQYDFCGAGPQIKDTNGTTPPSHINLPDDGTTGGVVRVPAVLKADSFGATITASGFALGRDAPVIPESFRIARIWVSGNGTFSMGNAASGTEIVNAFTATSTTQPATLAGFVTSSRKLYVTLGTATTLTYNVEISPVI
jgi:hypothetical protein